MINLDLVRNLEESIDTMYAAARSEIFRPLDQYPRWHTDSGISDEEFGARAGRITYSTDPATEDQIAAWGAANPTRAVYLQRVRDTLQALTLEADDAIDELRAVVMRTTGVSKSGVVKERFFLHLEIDWADDTLVREYAL